MTRIFLSPPDVGSAERDALLRVLDSGWVTPAGPCLADFEAAMTSRVSVSSAVALSSGTAALHLALEGLGVTAGDDVVVSTWTFAASAFAVAYVGGRPVFIDSSPGTWTMSPDLLRAELDDRNKAGEAMPKAVVVVDLYGQCADYDALTAACAPHGIPIVADAAESLGATYRGCPAGSNADLSVLSFNGNKVITTGGGGMLLGRDEAFIERARYLASQARQPVAHYEHTEIGFNYRMSNVLAAIGVAQLAGLDVKVSRRRSIRERYRDALAGLPLAFMPEAEHGESNAWLTCITLDLEDARTDREGLRLHLESLDVESRPLWKPMHRQPVFADAPARVDGTSDRLFDVGLCLPSGSGMSDGEQDRVIEGILAALG